MKVTVIQPPYSMDLSKSDAYFEKKLELLNECDDSSDIIVLPEYSDVPCAAGSREENLYYHKKYINRLLDACKQTAIRCNSILFVNALYETKTGYRNTTYAFDRQGNIIDRYYKKHLPPSEQYTVALDSDYTFEYSKPHVLEHEGIRFGFLTCYDFYFYEAFANIARENVDIIIGCSLQRSDTHSALEIMGRFLCYNTNAYLIRASVALDNSPDICGASMIVTPKGDVLVNMKAEVGVASADIDLADKYYKPAGFGGKMAPHYEYIEFGRHPWQYRPGGSAIIAPDEFMPYPRICAHRGFNTVAPENSMAAFGAAVALGAVEIEFDLWPTKDGEIVSVHDSTLKRVSTGEGKVYEKTYDELLQYDFGVKHSQDFEGLKVVKFEDILKKFSCHTIMNIHLKSSTKIDLPISFEEFVKKVSDLIHKYDCEKYCYFMTGDDRLLEVALKVAPHITRCCGGGETDESRWNIVERAIKYDCKKLQFFTKFYNQQMIDKAKAHGIICNYFYCDTKNHAKQMLDMGIDTVLTNDYGKVRYAIEGEK